MPRLADPGCHDCQHSTIGDCGGHGRHITASSSPFMTPCQRCVTLEAERDALRLENLHLRQSNRYVEDSLTRLQARIARARAELDSLQTERENLRRQHANDVEVAARTTTYSGDYLARAMHAEDHLGALVAAWYAGEAEVLADLDNDRWSPNEEEGDVAGLRALPASRAAPPPTGRTERGNDHMSDERRITGVNRRTYPSERLEDEVIEAMHRGDTAGASLLQEQCTVTTVLVTGPLGDYAAYHGFGKPEWVADHGDKMRFEEACMHFPGGQLVRELYRL